MRGLLGFAWRRKGSVLVFCLGMAASAVAFDRAISLEEGKKNHLRKQLGEAREMPRRLLT
jgi:hypothetical protein